MSSFRRLLVAVGVVWACACQVESHLEVVPPFAAKQAALAEGLAVIATLRAPDDDAHAIAVATDAVLAQLPVGQWRLVRRYQQVAAVALHVEPIALAALRRAAQVDEIGPDRSLRTTALAADVVGATVAHKALGLTGAGVRIAVIDSGIDATHPDLKGKVIAEKCFAASGCPGGAAQGSSAKDDNGHGTHVASLLAGAGKVAPKGIAPGAQLVAVRTIGVDGTGATSDLLAGLDWVAKQAPALQIRLINLSLGSDATFAGGCNQADPAMAKAVALLRKKGVAVFAAAGNGAVAGGLSTPACLTGVTSVGATYSGKYGPLKFGGLCSDKTSGLAALACFSNRSKDLDLAAPGAFLTGAALGGGTVSRAGTSQACPIAVGAAALLLSCNPALTPDGLQSALQKTGKPIADPKTGATIPLIQVVPAAALVCP